MCIYRILTHHLQIKFHRIVSQSAVPKREVHLFCGL